MTDDVSPSRTLDGPEHQQVRLPTIKGLVESGWDSGQLRWKPEWRVPQSPHDAAKREDGKSFAGWPVDLAIFDDVRHAGDWEHLLAICEFKAPSISTGISQLELYLAREPRAKMGFWTNGSEDVRVYKLADGTFQSFRNHGLPQPGDDFTRPSKQPLKFGDLVTPKNGQLRSIFSRLLDVVVARDSRSTRSESQLNELCNLLLLKLESDSNASYDSSKPVSFQLSQGGEKVTAQVMRQKFFALQKMRPEVFSEFKTSDIELDDHTIKEAVYELSNLNLLDVRPEAISSAFQVFRRANLKAGEGQYFTPQRVISAAVKMMDIRLEDKIIDPACGTGGFLTEAFLSLVDKHSTGDSAAAARTWAHRQVYGVDKDSINVKLTRAIMVSLGDGSVNVHTGDSIRGDRWAKDYPHLERPLSDESFTVVLTNPPFGKNLKVSKTDARRNGYTIAAAASRKAGEYADLEIGLVFLERSYRLLMQGGRLGIILPETYFFSPTYKWLPGWLNERFILRGVFNIPMEAFQGFCRAKTNFYVFEKK
ncbi:SAM-dependent DNA methyltransferase [Streptomyces sp. ISL-112]|uniref:HsdM family class I SAM-dependent methyltransferase n=1 Tax=unclassified Streptomyces TaxID=2593676 RepID=UPI001BE5D438|nr:MULTISPECIES: N-6 DNA methylase [unclassified Streptomyces]MBT2425142.1 SAM-dependent DNA methyltransferase [Streptomyces sp. ISL-112]MBT2461934.1 SAM-dependent DNA methyltransferase [Streptomyces sp. ISL-63]